MVIIDLFRERTASLTARREQLLRDAAATAAGEAGQQAELLQELAALQDLYQVHCSVFVSASSGSLMSEEQFAAYMVAAYP